MTQPTTPPPAHPPGGGGWPTIPVQPAVGHPPSQTWYAAPPGPGWHPTAPNGAPLADFGQRLLAYLVDAVIVTVVWLPIWVAGLVASIMFLDRRDASDAAFLVGAAGAWVFGLLVLHAAYYVYLVEMMFRTGQTVGKRIMNIRVVPTDPHATLTRAMAARRWLVEIPAALVLSCVAFAYIDGLWQLWDKPYRQCLHDKYARTVVVKVAA